MESRVHLAAAPPLLQPPAGLTLMNPATVPMFVNSITGLNPLLFHYDADTPNHYSVSAEKVEVNLGLGTNPATGAPYMTDMFSYVDANPSSPLPSLTPFGVYYGKSFEVHENQAIGVTWINNLPEQHVLNIDPTLMDMEGMEGMGISYDPLTNSIAGGVPIVSHLHGGHTDAIYDGTPEQWYNAGGAMGMDYTDTQEYNPTQPANTFTYRNDKDAANLWYHDHAMGVTRLNAYAGMAGFYIIRNSFDTGLANNPLGLPAGPYEMGLAIQDKQFLSNGQLWYAAEAQSYTDDVSGHTGTVASTLPEQFGDVILVNGQAWPKMDVEARRYRFRIINGSDSRFYTMRVENPKKPGTSATPIWQIGTDDGLLNKPVKLAQLTVAPGERVDFIVDFTSVKPGTRFMLSNIARTPFPAGAAVVAGQTDRIMAFDVIAATSPDTSMAPSSITNLRPGDAIAKPTNVAPTRQVALYETTDAYGRVTPLMGTPASSAEFMDPTTENIALGSTEVWQIYNNTADTHPIHLHQVAYQVLTRGTFTSKLANLGVSDSGVTRWGMTTIKASVPVVVGGNEIAWKDTIQIAPGEVITVRATFDLPGKYVTHCHILSHEEHDMMRYMQVGSEEFPAPGFVVDSSGAKVAPKILAPSAVFSSMSVSLTDDEEDPLDRLLA